MKKITIQNLIDAASANNGQCLSEKFETVKSKYVWSCKNELIWEATFNNIAYNGMWCPFCSKKKQLAIKDMHELAAKRNGKCLSTNYTNLSTKLRWQCSEGHVWEATSNNIENRNSWCRECNRLRNAASQYEHLKNFCEMHQITIKNSIYVTNNTPMDFHCLNGHVWNSTPRQLKKGFLCPICRRN